LAHPLDLAVAPLELPWVAFHINRTAWPMVPAAQHGARRAAGAGMVAFVLLLGLLVWHFPQAVLWAYAIPLALFAWIDFLLTQAEHYNVAVRPPSCRRDPGAVAHDIVLPAGLGWLTLNRSLHRVHHRHRGLRWFEAPARLREDATAAPISYAAFVRRWLAEGSRLWTAGPAAPAPDAAAGEAAGPSGSAQGAPAPQEDPDPGAITENPPPHVGSQGVVP
jgi:fatty acid desaturase